MSLRIWELTDADRGRAVVYRSPGGDKVEQGYIRSWNSLFIFVDYGHGYGAATRPEDLEFLTTSAEQKRSKTP